MDFLLTPLPQGLGPADSPTFAAFKGLNGQTIVGNSSGAWTLTANGNNQSVIAAPSGTGVFQVSVNGAAVADLAIYGVNQSLIRYSGGLQIRQVEAGNPLSFYMQGSEKARFAPTTGNLLLGITLDGIGNLQFPTGTTNANGLSFRANTYFYAWTDGGLALSHNGNTATFRLLNNSGNSCNISMTNTYDLQVESDGGAIVFKPNNTTSLTLDTTLGMTQNGATAAATTNTRFRKTVTAIANAVATGVLTVTVPNAAHSGQLTVTLTGSLGAGGAIGANEATGVVVYYFSITRTAGVAVAVAQSAAIGTANTNVAGGATITVTAVNSGISGAVGATNTFTINVTITRGGGASTNHTCQIMAELDNANASGITLA